MVTCMTMTKRLPLLLGVSLVLLALIAPRQAGALTAGTTDKCMVKLGKLMNSKQMPFLYGGRPDFPVVELTK